jgi:cysteinyl-tRNA synthetase
MSKSLGNFFTVRDLLEQGWPGEVIRFVYLQTHYSKPMDWTEEKARAAKETLRKWRRLTDNVDPAPPDTALIEALSDDLNTAGAIAELHRLANVGDAAGLKRSAMLLGLLENDMGAWFTHERAVEWFVDGEDLRPTIVELIGRIAAARQNREYAAADSLRDGMRSAGVEISFDRDGGFTYKRSLEVSRSKLEALL